MKFSLNTPEDIQIAKELISPPGDTLSELLTHRGLSQKELADRMGRPIKTISEIINGKTAITPETARELELVLGVPASFWVNREQTYRLELASIAEAEMALANLKWLENFPIKEMVKMGWLTTKKIGLELYQELCAYLGVANPEGFDRTFIEVGTARYRRSLKKATNPYALAVWFRQAERELKQIIVEEYSAEQFKDTLQILRSFVESQPSNLKALITQHCAKAGVYVTHTECLKNTPIDGVTRWIGGNPLIQLSSHLKTTDKYWFTFYHEAAHVLMHPQTNVYFEGVDGLEDDHEYEMEANSFAQAYLLDEKAYTQFKVNHFRIIEEDIIRFAQINKTDPGILVGRLQKDSHLPWNTRLNKLKRIVN